MTFSAAPFLLPEIQQAACHKRQVFLFRAKYDDPGGPAELS